MTVDLEELGRKAREVEPAWDDLREQRVLEAIRRTAPGTAAKPAVRGWAPLAAAAIVLLAVGVGLYASGAFEGPSAAPVVERPAAPTAPAEAEAEDESEMVLADGSSVALGSDARVRLERQEAGRVVLVQERGRAVYRVSDVPSRAFEVRTAAAVVRVRGTVFVVDVDEEGTRVEVQEGRVEVEARVGEGRRAMLGAGDALSVAAAAPIAAEQSPDPPAPEPPAAPEPPVARDAPAAATPPSADQLLDRADEARRDGEPAAAAEALAAFLARHASDGRAPSAAFTLGRVRNRLGRHAAAAQAFAQTRQLAPAGPLAEDALAQEALAWAAAGEAERARAAVAAYEAAHPDGLHRARLQRLLTEE